jgi:hypothetical protein
MLVKLVFLVSLIIVSKHDDTNIYYKHDVLQVFFLGDHNSLNNAIRLLVFHIE